MAAYAHNFVVSIIGPNGQPIREKQGQAGERTIRLPFESEYKIRLKNKNNRRAVAVVFIDGMDIAGGRQFILDANSSVDVERFITDGDMTSGSKFKFINREKGAATGELQDPTSNDLGKVEVSFYPEKIYTNPILFGTVSTGGVIGTSGGYPASFNTFDATSIINQSGGDYGRGGAGAGGMGYAANTVGAAGATATNASNCQTSLSTNSILRSASPKKMVREEVQSEVGGTAMGAESNQQFQMFQGYFATESTPIRLSIRLKGLVEELQTSPPPPVVSQPVTAEKVATWWRESAELLVIAEYLLRDNQAAESWRNQCIKLLDAAKGSLKRSE